MAVARAPRPRYSAHERQHWLAHGEELRGPRRIGKTPLRHLIGGAGTPSRASWYRWRKERDAAERAHSRMGRPPRLNKAEQEVLAGRVLWRVHHPNPVSADWAINWTRQAFGVTYSRPGMSKLLRSLGIRAHRTKRKTQTDTREPIRAEMISSLRRMREAIEQRADLSAVVAMDEMTFTSSGVVGWSYSAVGGYENSAQIRCAEIALLLTAAQGPAGWGVPRSAVGRYSLCGCVC